MSIVESKIQTFQPGPRDYEKNYKLTYKRLEDKIIGGYKWFQLYSTSNYENNGTLPYYFLKKDNYYWDIRQTFRGGCGIDEIEKMLQTFQFTK